MNQRTIAKQLVFNGYGIHTGKFAEVTMSPLKPDSGLIFRSSTLTSRYFCPNVRGTERGTEIVFTDGSTIQTVEHLVSALTGLGLDNVLVEVDGDEAPIKDGSARFVVEQILAAGIQEQNKPKNFFNLKKPRQLTGSGKFILALPAAAFKVNFLLDYTHPVVQTDVYSFEFGKTDFVQEIAPARTYGFQEEIAYLLQHRLARGATLQNALVIGAAGFSQALRFPDELVRHKILDFIGDIAALGALPQAEFFVYKSGHIFNQQFVKTILADA
ncbi:MAG: UDP-3-O-acyl-N-acetylglucosamine deacetylase [Candidatus Margulisbacteria bacterium]|jgi:UDP-3-O-[3-hydroxymyristoyl] N-acetylglucosamine deacetylase|nr:UDP-3-O-acyl-N-acetylglucosamine deacetylase [Candidatus Margulisiibacteriota bacterium]